MTNKELLKQIFFKSYINVSDLDDAVLKYLMIKLKSKIPELEGELIHESKDISEIISDYRHKGNKLTIVIGWLSNRQNEVLHGDYDYIKDHSRQRNLKEIRSNDIIKLLELDDEKYDLKELINYFKKKYI